MLNMLNTVLCPKHFLDSKGDSLYLNVDHFKRLNFNPSKSNGGALGHSRSSHSRSLDRPEMQLDTIAADQDLKSSSLRLKLKLKTLQFRERLKWTSVEFAF